MSYTGYSWTGYRSENKDGSGCPDYFSHNCQGFGEISLCNKDAVHSDIMYNEQKKFRLLLRLPSSEPRFRRVQGCGWRAVGMYIVLKCAELSVLRDKNSIN
jgi:hypothetical protein